jgi:mRNA-degrading endonuclease RelE of RelBE toxin-antitoxin system
MKIQMIAPFDRDYDDLPASTKEQTDKQLSLFLDNPHHPSLRVKKIKGSPNIWEGRIIKNCRFTCQIAGEIYILRRIGTHHILKTP